MDEGNIICIIVCLLILLLISIVSSYFEYKEHELIIKESDNYTVYDNCYLIDNKYYCNN